MGLLLFVLVASLLYDRLVFHPLPAAPLAPSLWIGLGPIGVGGLALLRLGQAGAPVWGDAAPAVQAMSLIGASALWGFGPLVARRRRRPARRLPAARAGSRTGSAGGPSRSRSARMRRARSRSRGPGTPALLEALAAILFVGLVAFWVVVAAGTLRARPLRRRLAALRSQGALRCALAATAGARL